MYILLGGGIKWYSVSKLFLLTVSIEKKNRKKRRSNADTDVLAYLEAKHESQVHLRERELDIKEKELELQTAQFQLEKDERETRLKHETAQRMAILQLRMDLKK